MVTCAQRRLQQTAGPRLQAARVHPGMRQRQGKQISGIETKKHNETPGGNQPLLENEHTWRDAFVAHVKLSSWATPKETVCGCVWHNIGLCAGTTLAFVHPALTRMNIPNMQTTEHICQKQRGCHLNLPKRNGGFKRRFGIGRPVFPKVNKTAPSGILELPS